MSSEKKKNELDRRDFMKRLLLGTGVIATSPIDLFIGNMISQFMTNGLAHAAGDDKAMGDMKFISLLMQHGASRYYWDLPLKPTAGDLFAPNPMVITKFIQSGGVVSGTYATTQVGPYQMSSLWNAMIPVHLGNGNYGSVSMKNLAPHMMSMRGLDLQIDSHELDRVRQFAPISGGATLTGLAADQALTAIPAVGRKGGGDYFRSLKGMNYVDMDGSDPLSVALNPFLKTKSMLSMDDQKISSAIDAALLRMSAASEGKHRYLPSTFATRLNAKKMMIRSFGNLQNSFLELQNKYEGLISRAFGAQGDFNLAGIDDIVNPGGGPSDPGARISDTDYFSGPDLRTLTNSNTTIEDLAAGMAVAEFMITQGLSSSVNIAIGNIINADFSRITSNIGVSRSVQNARIDVDSHSVGARAALIAFSRYFRAISACLYELTLRLKATPSPFGNVFNQTVLAVTSDFNRIPRNDGSGSDHGWQGSNFTLLSGMVDQLMVKGNIKSNAPGNWGTWGLAGNLPELSGRTAVIGNAASTVANLLEVKSPTPNDQPFFVKKNGKALPFINSCKNDEEAA